MKKIIKSELSVLASQELEDMVEEEIAVAKATEQENKSLSEILSLAASGTISIVPETE